MSAIFSTRTHEILGAICQNLFRISVFLVTINVSLHHSMRPKSLCNVCDERHLITAPDDIHNPHSTAYYYQIIYRCRSSVRVHEFQRKIHNFFLPQIAREFRLLPLYHHHTMHRRNKCSIHRSNYSTL